MIICLKSKFTKFVISFETLTAPSSVPDPKTVSVPVTDYTDDTDYTDVTDTAMLLFPQKSPLLSQ